MVSVLFHGHTEECEQQLFKLHNLGLMPVLNFLDLDVNPIMDCFKILSLNAPPD